jgi:hypothetical protein
MEFTKYGIVKFLWWHKIEEFIIIRSAHILKFRICFVHVLWLNLYLISNKVKQNQRIFVLIRFVYHSSKICICIKHVYCHLINNALWKKKTTLRTISIALLIFYFRWWCNITWTCRINHQTYPRLQKQEQSKYCSFVFAN